MLEATLHRSSVFVTLTYADEKLPLTSKGLPTLEPKHPQNWLKRLRKNLEPEKIRFFLVGEYGDETFRPHYHAALFNVEACVRGTTRTKVNSSRSDWSNCCAVCRLVGRTWGLGDVQVGNLEDDSAGYLAGYVTKKMTRYDDPRLRGRWPEFSRMSLRPGIGHDFMWESASAFLEFNLVAQPDVPSGLRHGNKVYPLGRYLQRRYRKFVGRDEKAPDATIEKIQAEVQSVREAAFDASKPFAQALKEDRKGQAAKMKTRSEIFKQRKSL